MCFVGFLVGFITVLCIGNYFRAKRAQERQRQRRLNKLAAQQQQNQKNNGGNMGNMSGSRSASNDYQGESMGYEAPMGGVPA